MTTEEPLIRRATAADAAPLAAFAERTFRETFAADNRPGDLEQYVRSAFGEDVQRAELENPARDTLLVEAAGALAGYAQMYTHTPPREVGVAGALELRRFYVDRRWHGTGLAQALMRAVEAAAAGREAGALWLGVWERNARAIAFYRASGFLDVGSQPFMMGTDPQTDRIMSRPLASASAPARAPECLYTQRLALRRPRAEDADAILERYSADAVVTRYLSWPRHRSTRDAQEFLAFSDAEWVRWPAGPYLIHAREDGRLLGGTGLAFETPWRASTGYVLARDAWGHGYATESVRAMVDVARATGLHRLSALCHTAHRASARVLEKGGFTLEATLRQHSEFPNLTPGAPSDVYSYVWIVEQP